MGVDATRTVRIDFIAEDQNVGTVLKSVDGKLRDVRGRFISAGAEAELFGETARRAGQQAATGFGRVKTSAKAAQSAIKGAAAAGQTFVSNMKSVGLLGLGFSAVAGAAREVLRVVDELATESLQTQQVTENLQISIEGAAEGFKGYVSNIDLAIAANRAVQFGVVETGEEFAGVARGVQAIAEKTGQSSAKLLDQFVVGVARRSAARLDDLGILLTVTKAERIWAEQLGKTRDELTLLEKDEAFQKVALMQIAEAGEAASSSIDGFAVTVVRAQIDLQNAKSSFFGFDDSLGKVRESLRGLSDEQLDTLALADFAAEGSGALKRANAELEQFGVTVQDIKLAARDTGIAFEDLVKGQVAANADKAAAAAAKEAKLLNEENVRLLREQAETTQFQADLIAAGGESQELTNQFTREAIDLRRQAAALAGDEAKELALTRELALSDAKAAAATSKGRGGGVTRAERLLVAGEQRVAQMEQMAVLAGVIAEDSSQIADAAEFERAAALERLTLEREALEVTRARGKFAKQELANELAANEAAAGLLRTEGRIAAQEREKEELAEIISLETARSANEAQAAAARMTMLGNEFEAREILRQQAELELVNNSPASQLEIIEQRGALAQLEHEREMDRKDTAAQRAEELAAREEQLHRAELGRIEEKKKQQKAALDASAKFLSTGQQLASTIISASIKDEDKRAKAELKARGIAALGIAAVEGIKSVAAFADFNFVQGALHATAATLAAARGFTMIAGGIPALGGAGAGGGSAAAPAADRETGDAARTVESLPAVDREPTRQPTGQQQGGGNVTTIENLNVTGAIDDETVEKIRLGLDNVNNGLEATG